MSSKAIIFDLNGVFIKSPPLSERFEADFGVPASEFLATLNEVMAVVRKPNAPDTYSLFEPHLRRWNVTLGREAFYHYWFSGEGQDDDMLSLARELKNDGIRIFALSNNFRERCEYYHSHFVFMATLFDEVFYSWRTGLLKPDPLCWSLILQKYKLNAADVLYFDDSEKNVAAAKSIGIKAFKFEGVTQVQRLARS